VATVALEGSEGTQPGGYDDQVRAVRVQAGDSRADEHEARLGGHGYPAQPWAVRASASFGIPPSGGELSHVLGHAVLHLRWMSLRSKVRQSLAFINPRMITCQFIVKSVKRTGSVKSGSSNRAIYSQHVPIYLGLDPAIPLFYVYRYVS